MHISKSKSITYFLWEWDNYAFYRTTLKRLSFGKAAGGARGFRRMPVDKFIGTADSSAGF